MQYLILSSCYSSMEHSISNTSNIKYSVFNQHPDTNTLPSNIQCPTSDTHQTSGLAHVKQIHMYTHIYYIHNCNVKEELTSSSAVENWQPEHLAN